MGGSLIAIVALTLIHNSRKAAGSHPPFASSKSTIGFDEVLEESKRGCTDFPFVHLLKVKQNNLGGHGPDSGEEGLVYIAKTTNTGLNTSGNDLEIHLHANGTQYKPAWADHNGIQGRFAVFNVNPGTSVSMKIHAVDPETDKEITVPHVAFTFFDLDTGEDNVKSVEYIKVRGHSKYYLSNETEVNVTHESDGWTMFKATKQGTGDDNPSDPTALS